MNIRQVSRAFTAALLTCGMSALAPAAASAQQKVDLPRKEGPITMTGCFLRVKVDNHEKFVLVRPTTLQLESVPEATCVAIGDDPMVELEDVHKTPHKHHLDQGKLGRWIEVSGRLESIDKGPNDLREIHVRSYRVLPVVVPRVAETGLPAMELPPFTPPPAPPLQIPLTLSPTPVGTTGVAEELPHTASALPLTALIGVLAVFGGFALHIARRRRFHRG